MEQKDVPYQKLILVCTNERAQCPCCAAKDSMRLVDDLKSAVEKLGLKEIVRVTKTGCLGMCALGANVMIYPDSVWLQQVTPADLPCIIEKHIALLAQHNNRCQP